MIDSVFAYMYHFKYSAEFYYFEWNYSVTFINLSMLVLHFPLPMAFCDYVYVIRRNRWPFIFYLVVNFWSSETSSSFNIPLGSAGKDVGPLVKKFKHVKKYRVLEKFDRISNCIIGNVSVSSLLFVLHICNHVYRCSLCVSYYR